MAIPYAEVIGDPVAHSKSPLMHLFWLEKLGIKADYRAVCVNGESISDYLLSRRADSLWRGCNVTMPLKRIACERVDSRTEAAKKTGAVNAIIPDPSGLLGTNTDVSGIVAALPDAHDAVACIIGAGGAASAALIALERGGAAGIGILARDPGKAKKSLPDISLPVGFRPFDKAMDALAGVDMVLNASPLGMEGQPPMPNDVIYALDRIRPDGFVLDMVYAPLRTGLLNRAEELRLAWADGLTMLIGQAAEAFRLFFGSLPPREWDGELRELLSR